MPRTDKIQWDFSYHKPDELKVELHEGARGAFKDIALYVDSILPECREKSLAITALEEAMMWTNAGIARNPRHD